MWGKMREGLLRGRFWSKVVTEQSGPNVFFTARGLWSGPIFTVRWECYKLDQCFCLTHTVWCWSLKCAGGHGRQSWHLRHHWFIVYSLLNSTTSWSDCAYLLRLKLPGSWFRTVGCAQDCTMILRIMGREWSGDSFSLLVHLVFCCEAILH